MNRMDKLLDLWRKSGAPGSWLDVCDWAADKTGELEATVARLKNFASGKGMVSEAENWVEVGLLVHGLHEKINRLKEENDRLTSSWFIDETILEDGSLRPSLENTLERIRLLEIENADLRRQAEEWIPCEAANPAESDWFMVTYVVPSALPCSAGKRCVSYVRFSSSAKRWDTEYKVIAWRKNPEAYREI